VKTSLSMIVSLIGTAGLAAPGLVSQAAELAKQGSFTGVYSWSSTGKAHEIRKDHVFVLGESTGTFFNDAGKGFLHQSSMWCAGAYDLRPDQPNLQGYCVATDAQGDKIALTWRCTSVPCKDADFEWMAGTGKYTGIRGKNKFSCSAPTYTPSGPSTGWCNWTARWELP